MSTDTPAPIRLHFLYTDYTHFGPHAGPRLIIDYIDTNDFNIQQTPVKKEKAQIGAAQLALRKLTRPLFTRKGHLFYYLEDYLGERAVANAAKQAPIDIVHYIDGDHSYQHMRKLLDARGQQHTRIISTNHMPPDMLERVIRTDTIGLLDHVFLVSPEQKPFFLRYLPEEKVTVIELGVSAQFYQPAATPPSDDVFRTITVGSHMRDYDALRKVAKLMADQPIEFHVVSRSIDPDPAYPNVVVHHGISDDALLALYQQSHLLLLPLSGSTANSALLEGMACRLAIATNDIVGPRFYLPEDERFFLPDRDPENIAAHVQTLMQDAQLRQELADKAYAKAEELAWPNIARRVEAVYRKVLANQPAK